MAEERKQLKPFNAVLAEIDRGRFHDEVSESLAELTKAVREQGKAGILTLKFKLVPMNKVAGVITITADVIAAPPRPERDAAVFFDDNDGNLLRQHPTDVPLPGMQLVDSPIDVSDAVDLTGEGANE